MTPTARLDIRLRARHVIHTVGPRWNGGRSGEAAQLASCYRSSLALARAHDLARIAFPAIATGVYGYPPDAAAAVACQTIAAELADHALPAQVVLVGYDAAAAELLRAALAALPA